MRDSERQKINKSTKLLIDILYFNSLLKNANIPLKRVNNPNANLGVGTVAIKKRNPTKIWSMKNR